MTLREQSRDECENIVFWSPHERLGPWSAHRHDTKVFRKYCAVAKAHTPSRAIAHEKEAQFHALVRQWKRETAIVGHLSKIVMHPAYQRIMAMGPDVIPLVLKEMSKEPGHWFWALHNLVPPGRDPAEGTTTIGEATKAWLNWGKAQGIL